MLLLPLRFSRWEVNYDGFVVRFESFRKNLISLCRCYQRIPLVGYYIGATTHKNVEQWMLLLPCKPVVQALMVPVKKHLGYLFSFTKYVRDINIKMRDLNITRLDVKKHMNRNTISFLRLLNFLNRYDSFKTNCIPIHVFVDTESSNIQLLIFIHISLTYFVRKRDSHRCFLKEP